MLPVFLSFCIFAFVLYLYLYVCHLVKPKYLLSKLSKGHVKNEFCGIFYNFVLSIDNFKSVQSEKSDFLWICAGVQTLNMGGVLMSVAKPINKMHLDFLFQTSKMMMILSKLFNIQIYLSDKPIVNCNWRPQRSPKYIFNIISSSSWIFEFPSLWGCPTPIFEGHKVFLSSSCHTVGWLNTQWSNLAPF